MKIAVFGYGDMGKLHLAMYKDFPNVEVTYLFGRNEAKLEETAKDFGINYTTNPNDIFQDKSIIGVDICVPTANHNEYIVPALKAGKHILCETPISFDLNKAKEMIDIAKTNRQMFMVATLMPFVDEVRYVVRQVNSGKLGKPVSAYAYRHHRPYEKVDPVLELMTFEIDSVTRILGKPYKVFTKTMNNKGADHTIAILEYDGAEAVIETSDVLSKDMPIAHGLRVICTEGIIESNTVFTKPEPDPPQTMITLYPKGGKKENIEIETHFPYKEECKYFIDCLEGKGDPDYINAEKAYADLQIAFAVKESIKLNSEVQVKQG